MKESKYLEDVHALPVGPAYSSGYVLGWLISATDQDHLALWQMIRQN